MEAKNPFTPSWLRDNRRNIIHRIEARYGKRWRACFPPDVQSALISAELLTLIQLQIMDKYAPAQELTRAMLADDVTGNPLTVAPQ